MKELPVQEFFPCVINQARFEASNTLFYSTGNGCGYFFDDVMKTPLEIGWILGTWTLFEIPVLLFSRRLIDRFGNRWLIVSGLLLSGLRLILFPFFTRETPYEG
jgi:MFS family permease